MPAVYTGVSFTLRENKGVWVVQEGNQRRYSASALSASVFLALNFAILAKRYLEIPQLSVKTFNAISALTVHISHSLDNTFSYTSADI